MDINAKAAENITSLMTACLDGHIEIVKELVKAGADVNIKNTADETALKIAKEKGHTEIVKLLKQAGAKE